MTIGALIAEGTVNMRQQLYRDFADQGTYAAESVVLVVLLGLLDHVPPRDFSGAVIVVTLVGDEVMLLEQLLLVMLELSRHGGGVDLVNRLCVRLVARYQTAL